LSKWQLIDAADLGWGKSAFGRTCWNILIWMKVFVTYDMSQLFEPAMTYKRSQIVGSQANSQRTHCSEAANIWGGLGDIPGRIAECWRWEHNDRAWNS
jgi:hypothetical protein